MKPEQHDSARELFSAVKAGKLLDVKRLLTDGADPNSEVNGSNVLSISVVYNKKDIALLLLNAGADPYQKNAFGVSPLELAKRDNYVDFIKLFSTYKVRKSSKSTKKKKYFAYQSGMSTMNAHLEYLAYSRDQLFERQYYKDTIELLHNEIKGIRSRVRGGELGGADRRTNEILAERESRLIPIIEEQAKKPYFGRLDIKHENGDTISYYLGSKGMGERVYEAQSYLGSIFAQKLIGKQFIKGVGNIEVTLLRQIDNANGKIGKITDKEWAEATGYIDPILMDRLNDNAKTKMNEIWETIQGEQDSVVRQPITNPIIVQGSAGSGKTIIALHRLSYLLYNYKEILEEQKIVIFGPSMMYIKYIQEAMPHLNIGDITQTTFQKFALERIPAAEYGFRLLSSNTPIQKGLPESEKLSSKVKGSLFYQKKLNEFLESRKETLVPVNGLFVPTELGDFTFDSKKIRAMFMTSLEISTPEASRTRVIEMLKAEASRFNGSVNWETEGSRKLTAKIRRKLSSKVNEYAGAWQLPTAFDLYQEFSCSPELLQDFFAEVEHLDEFVQGNQANFARKVITVDDLPPLLEVEKWLTGRIGAYDSHNRTELTNKKFHYVLVDEAQDYSPYQFAVINSLVLPGRIMLLGDLGQSIYDFRGINSWEEVLPALNLEGKDDYTHLELSKIYRSTVQIVQFANKVIRPYAQGRYTLSEPIGRDGTEPIIKEALNRKDLFGNIEMAISQYRDKGYSNIAVITRGWEEAKSLHGTLQKKIPDIGLITKSSSEYEGGVIIVPVFLTKGIEYDAVILADASMERYKDDDYNRKLLYVAVTRALHEVKVFHHQTLALPLLDVLNPKKAEAVREELKQRRLEEERKLKEQQRLEEERRLEEIRLKEERDLHELASKEQVDHASDFLKVVETEFAKVMASHVEEVIKLKQNISKLEAQIRELQTRQVEEQALVEPDDDELLPKRETAMGLTNSFFETQMEALFSFVFAKGKPNQVSAYLESLVDLDKGTRMNVQLVTLEKFLSTDNYNDALIVMESLCGLLQAGHNPSMDSIKFLLDIYSRYLLDFALDLEEIDLLYFAFFALLGDLDESKANGPFGTFLDENADYLIEVAFEINELPLLLKIIQVYWAYELSETVSTIMTRLFVEWEFFESQLNNECFVKLLWYSYYFNLDEFILDFVNNQQVDLEDSEIQLYYGVYDFVNQSSPREIPDLIMGLNSFTPKERALLQEKLEASVLERV
ncbi:UvrD-helicase domain-containing protein [Bacillus sp. EB01]|uniref:UvrD-helicase domain-containing protein n=1 Tax=Bacillus sp. EB01 TaxID=1347086 RepID=UPI0005C5F235|nr:UvrD-helicase domain-containing protein [Bacillus sp. EB01]